MAAKRILIVEDEGIIAKDIERALLKLAYQVVAAVPTGEEALAKIAEDRPDLVLMDIMLKGELDGIDTAQRIRHQYAIPVVYLTAFGDPTTLQRATATAPFGYLLKPFEERELYSAVETALYRHQMERDLRDCRQQIAGILATTFDAIMVMDRDGVVSTINANAAALTDWSQAEAVGKDWAEIFKTTEPLPSDIAGLGPEGRKLAENDNPSFAVLLAKTGRRTAVELRSLPMTDAHGGVDGTVVAFRAMGKG